MMKGRREKVNGAGEKFEIMVRRSCVVWDDLLYDWWVDFCRNRGVGLWLMGSNGGLGRHKFGKMEQKK